MKHTDAEVINAMSVIREHCRYFHGPDMEVKMDDDEKVFACEYCVLGRKADVMHHIDAKGKPYRTVPPGQELCMLTNKYHKCEPWLWKIPETKDLTLF